MQISISDRHNRSKKDQAFKDNHHNCTHNASNPNSKGKGALHSVVATTDFIILGLILIEFDHVYERVLNRYEFCYEKGLKNIRIALTWHPMTSLLFKKKMRDLRFSANTIYFCQIRFLKTLCLGNMFFILHSFIPISRKLYVCQRIFLFFLFWI